MIAADGTAHKTPPVRLWLEDSLQPLYEAEVYSALRLHGW